VFIYWRSVFIQQFAIFQKIKWFFTIISIRAIDLFHVSNIIWIKRVFKIISDGIFVFVIVIKIYFCLIVNIIGICIRDVKCRPTVSANTVGMSVIFGMSVTTKKLSVIFTIYMVILRKKIAPQAKIFRNLTNFSFWRILVENYWILVEMIKFWRIFAFYPHYFCQICAFYLHRFC
jgi:hypothetical protein